MVDQQGPVGLILVPRWVLPTCGGCGLEPVAGSVGSTGPRRVPAPAVASAMPSCFAKPGRVLVLPAPLVVLVARVVLQLLVAPALPLPAPLAALVARFALSLQLLVSMLLVG